MKRFLRFSVVGIAGTGVQLLALTLYLKLHMNYLAATAAAVETAILHNYLWHRHWTWQGRHANFWRFQLSNGAVSIASNVVMMRLLTGWAGIPPVPANLAAIAITSLVNFWLGDRWVFAQRGASFAQSSASVSATRCAPLPLSPAANPEAHSRSSA